MIILAVVMVWMGGCAVDRPLTLSVLMSGGSHSVTGGNGHEEGAQTGAGVNNGNNGQAGSEGQGAVIVTGNTGAAPGGEVEHGHLEQPPARGSGSNAEPSAQTDKDAANESTSQKPEQSKPGEREKVVALTFDDGPDALYTTAILDILKEKGVKATFFVVGQQVTKNPEVLKRIVDEGHEIGNHTYNHKNLSKLGKPQIWKEVEEGDAAIKKAAGFTPSLFRAPFGAVSYTLKNVLKAHDRKLIGWTVDTRDWAGTSPADMRKLIRNETKPGGIILLHSFGSKHIQNTVKALPGIIDDLEKMGYSFVTADQAA
ncbi:polysaccharide deacetylase family protein [Paenibacillus sp. sgz302251]|uniref:polysaccharide deacetylase family protein n=1 Tax=Paenibacillus sp. sgz302251 TaxID=3414493 RepID=UPI003C7DE3F9